jgi:hypothetical protein
MLDHSAKWFRTPAAPRGDTAEREVESYIFRRRQPFHLGDMTMKVQSISKWARPPSSEERDAILPKEVPATLKLHLDGVLPVGPLAPLGMLIAEK